MTVNSKWLMVTSAITMGIVGILLTFLPEEIIQVLSINSNQMLLLIIQVAGALYFGFAMLNWIGKSNLIGGIYGRPVTVANLVHFFIGGMGIIRAAFANPDSGVLWVFSMLYTIFAIGFGIIFFQNPKRERTD